MDDPYFPDDKPPRYAVGVQSDSELCCYKTVFETKKFADAKEKAEQLFAKLGKTVILWDWESCSPDVLRLEGPKKVVKVEAKVEPTPVIKKRGRPKKTA